MKKTIAAILSLLMILSLAACGESAETSTAADTTEATEATEADVERDYYIADDYLANPDLFVPAWKGEFTPNPAMLDFEEKWESFLKPDGRMLTMGHRGERNIYYPENSLEAIMSVIQAGVDIVELDVHKTLDNVVVIMHDTDLLGTTNLALKRLEGDDDGLPESNSIRDWTLDELRQLRLTKGSGGEETEYVIPTLEDAIRVCKDHCFISLDDKKNEIDWNMDIFTLLKKHEAYRTVLPIFNYGTRSSFDVLQLICKTLANNTGAEYAPFLIKTQSTPEGLAESAEQIKTYDLFPGLRCGEYDAASIGMFKDYVGKYRIYMETLSTPNDNADVWKEIDKAGINVVMSNNHTYELIQYVADAYFN